MTAAAFADAIARELGSAPPADRIVAGRIVRFATNGKRGDSAGWCRLFEDGRGGVFGDWRNSGAVHTWSDTSVPLNVGDARRRRQEIAAAQAARLAEEGQRHTRVAENARRIWTVARRCDQHPYLERKQVHADGLRVQFSHAKECRDRFFTTNADGECTALHGLLLLVPLRTIDWTLWSLQAIDAGGCKAFMRGGRKRGLFHLVAPNRLRGATATHTGDVAICEGLATGLSVGRESNLPVFIAFDAGNLLPVAQQVRRRFPKARVIVCGDCDRSGVGQAKAEEAAAAIDGYVSIPPLTEADWDAGRSDWNDYLSAQAVREATA